MNLKNNKLDAVVMEEPVGEAYVSQNEDLALRSEEHTSELQSLGFISYAVFCLKKKNN